MEYLPHILTWRIRLQLLRSRISIPTVLSVIAITMSTWTFYKSNFYNRDSVQVVAIGGVDAVLPRERQDRIDLNVAIVNAGTREASVLEAELVALYREPDGGLSWVRLFPPTGQGFQPAALRPGEIRIIALITDEFAHEFFRKPRYSIPIDSTNHRIVEGIRFKSMDASGRVYSATYLISQFKIPADWKGGPKEFTFDCTPHELLKNVEAGIPDLPHGFDYPAGCRP